MTGTKQDIPVETIEDEVAEEMEEKTEEKTEKDPVKELEDSLKAAIEENAKTKDQLLRVSAEFENFKKRTVREMGEFRKYANESLVKELLPILDNLERAVFLTDEADEDNSRKSIVEGIELTLNEILKIFEKFDIKQIKALEEVFNPCFHQAVMCEETDQYPENTVIKELQKGYTMHDRLIRPAMVAVSSCKQEKENNEECKE